jgi:hypothetical protein
MDVNPAKSGRLSSRSRLEKENITIATRLARSVPQILNATIALKFAPPLLATLLSVCCEGVMKLIAELALVLVGSGDAIEVEEMVFDIRATR